jgi:hypothetical protein
MAAPKPVAREHELTDRKPRRIRESGKTADQRRPKHLRESVKRAVMRLPDEKGTRLAYLASIGVPEAHLSDLLNRVEGLHLSTTPAHPIAVERINGESLTRVRRRRRRLA